MLNLLVHQPSPSHFLRILFRVLQLFLFLPLRRLWETNNKHSSSSAFSKIEAEAGRRGTKFSPILVPKSFRLFSTAIMQKPKRNSRHDPSFPSRLRPSSPPFRMQRANEARLSLAPRPTVARERQRQNGRTDAVAKKKLAP